MQSGFGNPFHLSCAGLRLWSFNLSATKLKQFGLNTRLSSLHGAFCRNEPACRFEPGWKLPSADHHKPSRSKPQGPQRALSDGSLGSSLSEGHASSAVKLSLRTSVAEPASAAPDSPVPTLLETKSIALPGKKNLFVCPS